MSRSLNKAILIGNLTRDPETRSIANGDTVCQFSVATNRGYTTEAGEKKSDVEFHKIVTWGKLAELCNSYAKKASKIYIEGRLQTRKWTGQDGLEKQSTEIVADDVIFLDKRED